MANNMILKLKSSILTISLSILLPIIESQVENVSAHIKLTFESPVT